MNKKQPFGWFDALLAVLCIVGMVFLWHATLVELGG